MQYGYLEASVIDEEWTWLLVLGVTHRALVSMDAMVFHPSRANALQIL